MENQKVSSGSFLKDVFMLAITAFGGPNAHISLILEQFVKQRKYLSEEELIELNALCQFLPGPTSTQTLTAVGYKMGGPRLAFLSLLVWITPAVIIMGLLAIFFDWYQSAGLNLDWLRFLPALALGLILSAGYKIGMKTATKPLTITLFLASAFAVILYTKTWMFPVILVVAGLIYAFVNKKAVDRSKLSIKPSWTYLILFIGIFAGLEIAARLTGNLHLSLLEVFYRYGSLVFGGGQVLIPMMFEEMVNQNNWLSSDEFFTGYALVQGVPGPVFSFSAFAGGLSAKSSPEIQFLISLLCALALFLPGTLLIFFVYPIWGQLKKYSYVSAALPGINAAAGGFVAAAAWMFASDLPSLWPDLLIASVVFFFLLLEKIPVPLIVVACVGLGFLI